MIRAIQAVRSSAGIRGFWAGAPAGILQTVPSTALYMTTYERVLSIMRESESIHSIAPALAGAASRTFVVSVLAPMELIRTRQTGGIQGSILSIFRDVVSQHGARGLYRGWGSTVLRDAPFSAIYWLCFESFRPRYRRVLGLEEDHTAIQTASNKRTTIGTGWNVLLQPLSVFLSGASSGVIAAVITHPFDLWKTRMQILKPEEIVIPPVPDLVASPTDSIVQIKSISRMAQVEAWLRHKLFCKCNRVNAACVAKYMNETLFKGLPLRLAMIIPGGGIMITVYETAKTWDS